jgi:hypothetical protein
MQQWMNMGRCQTRIPKGRFQLDKHKAYTANHSSDLDQLCKQAMDRSEETNNIVFYFSSILPIVQKGVFSSVIDCVNDDGIPTRNETDSRFLKKKNKTRTNLQGFVVFCSQNCCEF